MVSQSHDSPEVEVDDDPVEQQNGHAPPAAVDPDLGDADELAQRRDVQALFDARDDAAQALREAPLRLTDDPRQAVDELCYAAVRGFVVEMEPILKTTDAGRKVWCRDGSPPLGTIPTPEPNLAIDAEITRVEKVEIDAPDRLLAPDGIVVPDVSTFIELPTPITVTVVVETLPEDEYAPEPQRRETERETTVPRAVSQRVFRECAGVLSAVGIGLDVSEESSGGASFSADDDPAEW